MASLALSPSLRRTVRSLGRAPGFTAAAVLTLALGLGATTAIFAVVYGVLLKPLAYPDAHELVSLQHTAPGLMAAIGGDPGDSVGLGESMYVTYREENRVFEHVGLWNQEQRTLTGLGDTEQIAVLAVAHGTLHALGIQPSIGRWFTDAEYTLAATDAPEPVLISHAFWQRRFGGDPAALGRTLSLEFRPAQVVGIMPSTFRFLDLEPQPDVVSAIRTDGAAIAMTGTLASQRPLTLGAPNYSGLARLRAGVTIAQADADVARLLSIWLASWSPGQRSRDTVAGWQFAPALRPLHAEVVGNAAAMLWVAMGAVGAVLAIACANIANLLLARADGRRQELAVRAALGAGPRAIAGELMRESVVLGVAGGVLGIALAHAGLTLLGAFAPPNLPRVADISVSAPVLGFAACTALVASLAFGALPAFKHAFAREPRLGPRSASVSPERNRARNLLVVAQVALALVLLAGAGLMFRTFESLSAVEPGFRDPASIQATRMFIPFAAIADAERYTRVYREALDRIAALPGVSVAGFGNAVPLEGGGMPRAIAVEGSPEPDGAGVPIRRFLGASPGYFRALGTRLIAGRDLDWADVDEKRNVALVSANLATELWGAPEAALGKRIRPLAPGGGADWREIVGVTQDVYQDGLHRPPPSIVFIPLVTEGGDLRGAVYAIRTDRAGTESFADEVRQAISASHPDIVVTVRTMRELHSAALGRTSFVLALLGIAGAMGLFLAFVGIYGVVSYLAAQRKREIGIRLALGARAQAVQRLFILHGLAVAGIGLVAGLAAAFGLARFLQSLLFQVRPLDPLTYLAVAAVLLVASLLAAYLPARRATALDPMHALRAE